MTRRRPSPAVVVALAAVLGVAAPAATALPPGQVAIRAGSRSELVNVVNGRPAKAWLANTGGQSAHRLSADGRFLVLMSSDPAYVPGKLLQHTELFLADRVTKRFTRITRPIGDVLEPDGGSDHASTSADGRFVAYQSQASNLVVGDTPEPGYDVFLYDRLTGRNTLVSTNAELSVDGARAKLENGEQPVISRDGRWIAFHTTLQVAGKVELYHRAVLYERATRRATVLDLGRSDCGTPEHVRLSATGAYVAVTVTCHLKLELELDPGSLIPRAQVWLWDRAAAVRGAEPWSLVSRGVDGGPADENSYAHGVTRDGRYVLFVSSATNLAPTGRGGAFVHDRRTGVTERVHIDSSGADGGSGGGEASITDDGRYVGTHRVVLDRVTGEVTREWVHTDGTATQHDLGGMVPEGRFVAWDALVGASAEENYHGVLVRELAPVLGVLPGSVKLTRSGGRTTLQALPGFAGTRLVDATAPAGNVGSEQGQDLTGVRLAYQPHQDQLLLTWRVKSLPLLEPATMLTPRISGSPAVQYVARFLVGNVPYEVRAKLFPNGKVDPTDPANPNNRASFGLYRCTEAATRPDSCLQPVTELSGGLGSVGQEVRVGIPLDVVGAKEGTVVSHLSALSAVANPLTGLDGGLIPASGVLDQVPPSAIPTRVTIARRSVTLTVVDARGRRRSATTYSPARAHRVDGLLRFPPVTLRVPAYGRAEVRVCLGSWCRTTRLA